MNERYLFRGKRLSNGEWIIGWIKYRLHDGDLSQTKYDAWIQIKDWMDSTGKVYNDTFRVDPATVGQCTGLKDKNGKLIFEGDIFKSGETGVLHIIEWSKSSTYFGARRLNELLPVAMNQAVCGISEIIGNIHENKDLPNA